MTAGLHCDVLVSGGGIAGLAAAAAFASREFSVIVVDPAAPISGPDSEGADLRTTAYLRPSRDLLDDAGVWQAMLPHATPLAALRVIDTSGWPPHPVAERTFTPDDPGSGPFGWNVANWRARSALADTLGSSDRVELRFGPSLSDLVFRDDRVIARLSDGNRISARLVIGADGRTSAVRAATGIGVRVKRYGQTALAFAARHALPHGNVSTEVYNRGGAFTTVPMEDQAGAPASAIVWMDETAKARARASAGLELLAVEMTARSTGILGAMDPISPVATYPTTTQRATRLVHHRTALVAEAAHVMPPIGAQGLNTSLADIAVLAELATPDGLGAEAMLAAYSRARMGDILARTAAVDLLNRVCKSGAAPVQRLRQLGLQATHDIGPLRRTIMRAGLGPGG
ncbi:MAG: FAD-dependent monooxygenase [Pseudomonadota bacterium]